MKQIVALILSVAILASGCATAGPQHAGVPSPTPAIDPALMASYVRELPLGSHVRVDLTDGTSIRGTLMKADADPIVLQPRTRIPVDPVHIAIKDVRALDVERNGGIGRAVAAGAAAGAGAALGVILILFAIFAGD